MFLPIYDHNPRANIHRQYVTLSLIAINILIFFVVQQGTVDGSTLAYALVPTAFNGTFERPEDIAFIPEALTLLTYAFLHADPIHLAGNMLFLWVFGDNVEDAIGHWRFLLFYCLCAIGAGLIEVALTSDTPSYTIGASGAVAGVIGAYLILHPSVRIWILFLGKIPLRLSAMWVLGAWIAFQIWNAIGGPDQGVAWWAHIGGAATGAVLIFFLRSRNTPLFDRNLGPA